MTIAFVQQHGVPGTLSGASSTIPFQASPPAPYSVNSGEILVAVARWEGVTNDSVTGTFSDNQTNTWSTPIYSNASTGENTKIAVAWCEASATGDLDVVFTFSSETRNYRSWQLLRFSHTDTISLTDSGTAASGSNSATWTLPELTVASGDLLVAIVGHYNSGQNSVTPTDFSSGYDSGLHESFYRVYTTAGDYTVSAGWTGGNESYSTVGLVFHEAGGGGANGKINSRRIRSSVGNRRIAA